MNSSRGRVAVQWFATRHQRVKPKAEVKPPVRAAKIEQAPEWTAEEDAYVRKCYPTDGSGPIARALGRTPRAVQTRASTLGVAGPRILLKA